MLGRLFGSIFLAALTAVTGPSPQSEHVFESETRRPIRLPYLLSLPADYKEGSNQRWPLLLYLHGGSLRGDDVNRVRKIGLPHRLEEDRKFPFIVVSPLCPEGEIWTDTDALGQLLDDVGRRYGADTKRVYVVGHSMGGRGALYLAFKQPGRFAAVAALAPISPITAWAKELRKLPLWIIHGENDRAACAPIADSAELVQAMEQAGGHPKFTRLPDRDHFILDTFDRNEVFDWLLEHHR